MMNASLSLALGVCMSCAATLQAPAGLDRLPDLRARALAYAGMAIVAGSQDDTARAARIAGWILLEGPGAMDPTSTVSEEELGAWQELADQIAPQVALPLVTPQAWPGSARASVLAEAGRPRGWPAVRP